jgi:hypothetical protein
MDRSGFVYAAFLPSPDRRLQHPLPVSTAHLQPQRLLARGLNFEVVGLADRYELTRGPDRGLLGRQRCTVLRHRPPCRLIVATEKGGRQGDAVRGDVDEAQAIGHAGAHNDRGRRRAAVQCERFTLAIPY